MVQLKYKMLWALYCFDKTIKRNFYRYTVIYDRLLSDKMKCIALISFFFLYFVSYSAKKHANKVGRASGTNEQATIDFLLFLQNHKSITFNKTVVLFKRSRFPEFRLLFFQFVRCFHEMRPKIRRNQRRSLPLESRMGSAF